ncbi:MAG: Mur ligase family protein, partial [Schleiferiaceae bacterium]|nr:Mur ligase family protein [Schleiferiaceae bacterium]
MKLLNRLLQGIDPIQIHGQDNVAIQSMTADSRQIRRDSLFIARQGVQIDGHAFIEGAIQDGACAILCESMPSSIPDGVTVIQVVNSHRAYAMLAANWHGNPSKDLQVVGVTGTNGKTTVATLLHKLYMDSGIKSGLLSTISVHIHNEQLPATHTTPDAWDIQSHLAAMVTAGCKVAFMEVSSHGLAQERSHGIHFAGALFTNISRDHLDYHADMDEYVAIKKRLFDQLPSDAFALVNLDDKHGETMLLDCKARHFT